VDFPQDAIAPSSIQPLIARILAPSFGGQKVCGHLGFAGRLDDQPGLMKPVGDRLMHKDVLAPLHGGDRNRRMEMVGRHDLDGVYVFFRLEKLSKIRI